MFAYRSGRSHGVFRMPARRFVQNVKMVCNSLMKEFLPHFPRTSYGVSANDCIGVGRVLGLMGKTMRVVHIMASSEVGGGAKYLELLLPELQIWG